MNNQELFEQIGECTASQLKAVKSKCETLLREHYQSIEKDIMLVIEKSPDFKIRLGELKRKLNHFYSTHEIEEAVEIMKSIYGGYQVHIEERPEIPGQPLTCKDKLVWGWQIQTKKSRV